MWEIPYFSDGERTHNSDFDWVLPFHKPGLAPVGDFTGSYHICLDGNPAYSIRFKRTFGFYCNLATVVDEKGFFHIHPDGSPPIPIGGTGVETFSNKFALFEMKLENIIISK